MSCTFCKFCGIDGVPAVQARYIDHTDLKHKNKTTNSRIFSFFITKYYCNGSIFSGCSQSQVLLKNRRSYASHLFGMSTLDSYYFVCHNQIQKWKHSVYSFFCNISSNVCSIMTLKRRFSDAFKVPTSGRMLLKKSKSGFSGCGALLLLDR